MSWFSSELDTYEIQVADPDRPDETSTVTLRRLDGQQHAEVTDILYDHDRGEGQYRLAVLQRAIVSWELGVPVTPDRVAQLRPEVLQQIWGQLDPRDVNPFRAAATLVEQIHRPATETTASPAPADAAPESDDS